MAVVSPDGRVGVTATRPGEIRLWDMATGGLLAVRAESDEVVESAAFTGTGQLVARGSWSAKRWTEELVELPDAGEWVELAVGSRMRVTDDMRLATVVVPAGGRLLVGHDATGAVHAWHHQGRTVHTDPYHWLSPRWSYVDEQADQRLLCVCDDGRLVVSPRPGRLVVLDANTGAAVRTIEAPEPTALAGHPDLPLVALADRDGELRWWDAASGEPLGRVQAHGDRVRGLAVAAEGLVSASRDGTAALWDWDGALLGRFTPAPADRPRVPAGRQDPHELALVAGTPDGKRWLVCGYGGQVHVLDGELVPVRHGQIVAAQGMLDVDEVLDAIAAGGAEFAAVARTLAVPGALDELHGDAHPYDTDKVIARALDGPVRSDDPDVVEAAALALIELRPNRAIALCWELIRRVPGIAGRLLADVTGSEPPGVDGLLEQLPRVDHFTALLVAGALAEHGDAAVDALCAALREFPPGWEEIGHRVVWAVEFVCPRDGLQLMLTSATPRARNIAMDAYSSAHRDSRHGGLKPLYDSEELDRAVHDCAVRELAATEPGYGSRDNQYEAMYALWFCFDHADAPLIAQVLATTEDSGVRSIGLSHVEEIFQTDPLFDSGLLDALRRTASDPDESCGTRTEALRYAAGSAREEVVPWMLAALDDRDRRVVAGAIYALLLKDKERFAARVAPLLDAWEDTDGCGWEIGEARDILAGEES